MRSPSLPPEILLKLHGLKKDRECEKVILSLDRSNSREILGLLGKIMCSIIVHYFVTSRNLISDFTPVWPTQPVNSPLYNETPAYEVDTFTTFVHQILQISLRFF